MRLVLLGAPGSGKGTQGRVLAERFGVPLLSTGEMLRAQVEAGTELGGKVKPYLDRGALVPDELVLTVVADALAEAGAAGGFVLDGFPRTVAQARRLDRPETRPDAVVHLALDDDVALRRLAARDEGRSDDASRAVIAHRLQVFHDQTAPLLDFYGRQGRLVTVDAAAPPEAVTGAIVGALGQRDLPVGRARGDADPRP
jgi:adenylate kinase